MTDHHLVALFLDRFVLMPTNRVMYWRKDLHFGPAILACVSPNDEVKVGTTLAGLVFKHLFNVWSFTSLVSYIPRGPLPSIDLSAFVLDASRDAAT